MATTLLVGPIYIEEPSTTERIADHLPYLALFNHALSTVMAVGLMVTASHNPEPDNGIKMIDADGGMLAHCLLYTSPSPRDLSTSRMPSSA